MSIHKSLLEKLPKGQTNKVTGTWQSVQICPDMPADEWLNAGVFFQSSAGSRHVKMLDNFDRIDQLYDGLIPHANLSALLGDIEEVLISASADEFVRLLSPYARLSKAHYAAGDSPDSVLSTFYRTAVTLGRPKVTLGP